jgi:hypothetical protein
MAQQRDAIASTYRTKVTAHVASTTGGGPSATSVATAAASAAAASAAAALRSAWLPGASVFVTPDLTTSVGAEVVADRPTSGGAKTTGGFGDQPGGQGGELGGPLLGDPDVVEQLCGALAVLHPVASKRQRLYLPLDDPTLDETPSWAAPFRAVEPSRADRLDRECATSSSSSSTDRPAADVRVDTGADVSAGANEGGRATAHLSAHLSAHLMGGGVELWGMDEALAEARGVYLQVRDARHASPSLHG